MKKLIIIILLGLSISLTYGQCNCEKIKRNDGTTVTQCNPLPVANDNSTQIGLSIASNGKDNFVTLTIRFMSSVQNITGNLSIRLKDNNMITMELVNAQLAYIGNSQVAQAVFKISDPDYSKMKNSKIRTISIKLSDGLIRTYEIKMNHDVLIKQLNCI